MILTFIQPICVSVAAVGSPSACIHTVSLDHQPHAQTCHLKPPLRYSALTVSLFLLPSPGHQHVCTCTLEYMHAMTRTLANTQTHTHIHEYTHTHIHANTHEYHTHTHTNTHTCAHMQGAAGSYQRLREMVFAYLQTPPTPDMGAESTTALQSLMLAQAQECFVMKASRG